MARVDRIKVNKEEQSHDHKHFLAIVEVEGGTHEQIIHTPPNGFVASLATNGGFYYLDEEAKESLVFVPWGQIRSIRFKEAEVQTQEEKLATGETGQA